MKNIIYHYLRNRSIYSRVHRFNLIFAIASLIIITVVSIAIYTNISMIHLSENEGQSLYFYSKNIENKLYQIDNEIIQLTQKPENQKFLNDYLIMDDLEKYLSIRMISEELTQTLSMSDSVTEVFLFTNSYTPIYAFSGKQTDFNIDDFDYISFLKKTVSQQNNTLLVDGSDYLINSNASEGLLYGKRITDLDNKTINIGYIMLYINKETLFDFNSGLSPRIQDHAQHHVINQNDMVVYSSETDLIGNKLSLLTSRLKEEETNNNNYFFAGQSYPYNSTSMCAFSKIDVLNSYVITTIPYSFFASELLLIAGLLFLFLIILSVVSTFISRQVARSILVPITSLLSSLKAIQKSDFSIAEIDNHEDELAVLRNLLNETTQRISDLINQVKFAERQKFSLQFKALQAQINPHFLINTLNTVIWLADLQGANNIKQITSSLILILNNMLRDENKLINIRQEVELLKKYITIQKFKYFDRFSVTIEVDDNILSNKILKFILQPLVENCLIHGMSDNTTFLNIEIKIYKMDERLYIMVKDNGIGMTKERINEVLSNNFRQVRRKSGKLSIGLNNINSRIKLFYGEKYYLDINSEVGVGTIIKIALPLEITEDLDD